MRYSNNSIEKVKKPSNRNGSTVGQIILDIIIGLFTIVCLLSVILIIVVAFSSEASINAKGFSFFPKAWSLAAFEYVATFKGQLIQSYGVTIAEAISGTLLSLLLTSMFAYVLSRKGLIVNRFLSIYLIITMLFTGGLLGSYMVNTNLLHLRNNFLILILPTCITAWNTVVMRTFIATNVPDALVEAAEIDGAGEVYTFFAIILPLLTPVLAALGFIIAVTHWNEWQTAFLYIDDTKLVTLQLMLIRIEKNLDFLQERMNSLSASEIEMIKNAPSESSRMAILLITIGPVMCIYPFFQKYFIKGITMGSVKG